MRLALIFIVLTSFSVFGQENPWENKQKENPWKTTTQKEEANTSEKNETDADSTFTNKTNQTSSSYANKTIANIYAKQAKKEYKSGQAFGVGFATGLLTPGYGLVVNLAYTLHDSKQEKRIIEEIEIDSSFVSDSLLIAQQCEKKMKNKKFFTSLGGSIAGSMTTVAILLGLSSF